MSLLGSWAVASGTLRPALATSAWPSPLQHPRGSLCVGKGTSFGGSPSRGEADIVAWAPPVASALCPSLLLWGPHPGVGVGRGVSWPSSGTLQRGDARPGARPPRAALQGQSCLLQIHCSSSPWSPPPSLSPPSQAWEGRNRPGVQDTPVTRRPPFRPKFSKRLPVGLTREQTLRGDSQRQCRGTGACLALLRSHPRRRPRFRMLCQPGLRETWKRWIL